jgi:16S rRNA processing protein RimM
MEGQAGQRRVEIGTVGRAHGVKGEVRVFLSDPSSQTLARVPEVVLTQKGGPSAVYVVKGARPGGRFWVLRLAGVETREAAESLTGAACGVTRENLPALAEDEFYLADVLGFDVINARSAQRLGRALQVFNNGAHDVLVYGDKKEEGMVPFLKPFVESVDMEKRALMIEPLVWDE